MVLLNRLKSAQPTYRSIVGGKYRTKFFLRARRLQYKPCLSVSKNLKARFKICILSWSVELYVGTISGRD